MSFSAQPENEKYDYLVIDGHNMYHQAYHANSDLTHRVDRVLLRTGGIYGFLRMLDARKKHHLADDGRVMILFDNATSKETHRSMIDKRYKANREKQDRGFYRGVEILQLMLLYYSDDMSICYRHQYEADDLVPAVLSMVPRTKSVLMVSTDLDWARCITGRVHLQQGKRLYTPSTFYDRFNFYPSNASVTLYKAFVGDPSDNITAGLPKFPKKHLYEIASRYDDIYAVLFAAEQGELEIEPRWIEKLQDSTVREHLIRNFELISFQGIETDDIEENIFQCHYSEKNLRLLYESVGFNSAEFDSRMKPRETVLDPALGLTWDVPKRV